MSEYPDHEKELAARQAVRERLTVERRQVLALEQLADEAYLIRVAVTRLAGQKR